MYRVYLAQRWLLSRPINLLGMAGISVGVWALIVVVSIFSGFLVQVRSHLHAVTADLTVLNLPWPALPAAVAKTVRADPNVAAAAPRVVWYGLLHSLGKTRELAPRLQLLDQPGAESPLVSLVGVDPDLEPAVTGFTAWLRGGEQHGSGQDGAPAQALAPRGGRPAIVLSERRLRAEMVAPGHVAKLTSARLDNADGDQLRFVDAEFAIAGTFATRHTAFDSRTCFVHVDVLRQLLGGAPDSATELVVRCADPAQNETTAARLERALNAARPPASPRILVRTWQQMNEPILSAVDHQRGLMKLVLIVIMVVAAFLMYATLSMMVTEKTHDIGILTAMGASRRGVVQIFLSCGLAIAVAGTALGVALGCLSAIKLDAFNRWLRANFGVDLFPTRIYNLDRVPYDLDPAWIAQVVVIALGLGLVVSSLPAWWAARRDPVAALRNE